ncbi:unnamed protein product, partial [Tetraodon nigroviridis]
VRAVLKKRDYGPKYTQNNFITAVRAMNEFCLKPSDLEQLRRIRRRSPHDDTEAFTVFLRSDVEAKAIDVWGSQEALARERNLRKEMEKEYQENIFRNQQLLKEYKHFWGNTKPRAGKRTTFLQGPGKVVMVAICMYGFSNMRYIASLISGVGIFMMGAGLSWYHGIMGLLHPQPMESLLWVSVSGKPGGPEVLSNGADPLVLSYRPTVFWQVPWSQREVSLTNISFIIRIFHLFELKRSRSCFAATLLVAINEIKKSARQNGLSFYEYGNPYYDSLGSLGVGTLLGTVSAFLIYTNTEALLGRSIQAERVQKLTEFLENDPAVRAIHDVKATDMGLSKVRFKAEVDFDGRVVTRSYLEKQDIDQILSEIQQVKTPEELENFMLKHGENIIDTLGAEVDRLEKGLKQRNPEVRHVDLEIL